MSRLLRAAVQPGRPTDGRVFAIRKTEEAIRIPMEGFDSQRQRKGRLVQERNIESARRPIVVPPFPSPDLATSAVFTRHRLWWQVELAFRCFKALYAPGRSPKRAAKRPPPLPEGWLPVALLTEELNGHAGPAPFTVPDGTVPSPRASGLTSVARCIKSSDPSNGHCREWTRLPQGSVMPGELADSP